jgi:hypothetical protein
MGKITSIANGALVGLGSGENWKYRVNLFYQITPTNIPMHGL